MRFNFRQTREIVIDEMFAHAGTRSDSGDERVALRLRLSFSVETSVVHDGVWSVRKTE